jgi:signal transduction histidine kinase
MGVDAVGVLRVEVTDSAVGVNKEGYAKVFRENYHFNTGDLQGGGGVTLGLFISRRIINLHNVVPSCPILHEK